MCSFHVIYSSKFCLFISAFFNTTSTSLPSISATSSPVTPRRHFFSPTRSESIYHLKSVLVSALNGLSTDGEWSCYLLPSSVKRRAVIKLFTGLVRLSFKSRDEIARSCHRLNMLTIIWKKNNLIKDNNTKMSKC